MFPSCRPNEVICRFAAASAALCFASFFAASAHAQPADGAQEIVVTGTRTPQRVDRALAETTIIDRAQIEAATGRTLAELLAREAGVQIDSNGGLGKSASVRLRGLEARHTLLLIDGVRYGSATLGTPSWENLPTDAIERIEIVRGPLSGLYGSDAVGGVVQVFTRGGTAGFKPDAALTAGHQRHGNVAAGVRFGAGAFDGAVRLQHVRERGFSATNERVPFDSFNADDDGFRQTSASARGGLKFGGWRAEGSLLTSRGRLQYDDGLGADSRAALRTQVLSANVGGPVLGAWRSTLRASRSSDDYETLASASPFSELGTIGTVQRQFTWENTVATPAGAVLALVERTEQKVSRPGAPFDVSQRVINAAAIGLNGEAGAHGWQANLRHDRNSQFGRQTTGSLAYGFNVSPTVRIAASHGTSFVAPSFNQLYFPEFGNPDLQPEEGRQSELSLRWRFDGGAARLAYFDNRIRGYISSGPRPTNIPRTRIDGITGSVDAALGAWTLGASFDALNPVNDSQGTANFGKLLPRRASNSARASADWRAGAWTLGGTLAVFGDRFDDAANTTPVSGFALLDLRADWQVAADWRLGLSLNNALGKRYETVFGYNQPGREAFVSLRWAPR
jgi:vitamin B12 transporter